MTASKFLKNSTYLLSAFLLAACQPSPPTNEPVTAENSETVDTPIVITDDSVTMTPDHILSIKPSRYQPSLGLQGKIEPIKQTKLVAAYPINVEEILVTEGQWVEKDMPLLIVRRVQSESKTADASNPVKKQSSASNSVAPNSEMTNDAVDVKQTHSKKRTLAQNPINLQQKMVQQPLKTTQLLIKKRQQQTPQWALLKTQSAILKTMKTSANSTASSKPQQNQYNLITVRASFSGRVKNLYAKAGQKLEARTPLLQISDETKLHFIATLPIQAEPQLSVGQTVNFTAEGMSEQFTGQVSKLTATSQPKKLLVYVNVIDNEASRDKLLPDMKVTGRVNYGQIDVGTIVPKRALHDVDLTELQTSPYKPLSPLTANVWIIGQDQRLTRQPIEVVEYDPITKQYLIAGISNDSLICLADLPADAKGKKSMSHSYACRQLHCVETLTKPLLFCNCLIRQYGRTIYSIKRVF
ncbi:HlyD family efflux transporter periplasmic adaptor subunit [Psychrobacter sp. WY6]|uniref:efflux RND transporter periplasmic adaptor subunit n=1 Tax=Psychrobacter sp. WY6 TaxID=2708350 RepID=UPI0020230465|nr:HlyD family efflux transporter periplasmic adaptor subunit [Psychrobacter sp. WY6]